MMARVLFVMFLINYAGIAIQGFLSYTTCNPFCLSNGQAKCECPSTTKRSTDNVTMVPATKTKSIASHTTVKTFSNTLPTTAASENASAGMTECRKIMTRDGTISSADLVAGSPFQNDCSYVIDLGEGYQTGQKYVHVRFEQLQLQDCGACLCNYLQFENSDFVQRICSENDAQMNRDYKLKPTNTSRYLRLHYHTQRPSAPNAFRLHYKVNWGNFTNVCESVTCQTKCPHGVLQDFIGCPMCRCVPDYCGSTPTAVFVPDRVFELERPTGYSISTSSETYSWLDIRIAPPPSNKDRMKHRKDHILQLCNGHPNWFTKSMQGVIYRFRGSLADLAYCEVPKVGCTFWKRVLRFLNKDYGNLNVSRPNDISRFDTHMAPFVRTPKVSLIEENIYQKFSQMKNIVMFSRDPYSRQWAVYLDKFFLPDFWNSFGRSAIISQRRKPSALSFRCGHNLTFEEYLRYILGLMKTSSIIPVDFHFLPVHKICNPCTINFTYIGKQETFTEDFKHIADESKISPMLGDDSLFSDFAENEIRSLAAYYLLLAEKRFEEHPGCYNKSLICWRLWQVFQFNGYIGSDIGLPFWKLSNITDSSEFNELFIALSVQAHQDGKALHDIWRRQRHRSLMDAYRNLPDYLLKDFQMAYGRDFELFQYERSPNDIFNDRKDNFSSSNDFRRDHKIFL